MTGSAPPVLLRLLGADLRLGDQEVLHDLAWTLFAGESWAVMGPNGAGKSSFLRLARGEVWPTGGFEQRLYGPEGAATPSPLVFRRDSALVSAEKWQEMLRLAGRLTARAWAAGGFTDSLYPASPLTPAQNQRLDHTLAELGLGDLASRPLEELSQGQGKRLILARALVKEPRVLFLDEVGDGLDQASRTRVRELLAGFLARGGQLVLATHRPEDIPPGVNRGLWLAEGAIRGQGELAAVRAAYEAGPAAGTAAVDCDLAPARAVPAYYFRLRSARVFLERRPVLGPLDWEVRPGENWLLLGDNGAGKTTLLKLILGDYRPALGGEVRRFGPEDPRCTQDFRPRLGYVSAAWQARHRHPQSGLATVLSGATGSIGSTGQATDAEAHRARELLAGLGLAHLADRDIQRMSYGQVRRLLLARALFSRPWLLLLDEPTEGLDLAARRAFRSLVERLAGQGVNYLWVTHRPQEMLPSVTHVARLSSGRLVFQGRREGWPGF
ncbi:MAG: ATP-binding cassette domain-containing protein [Deltaproteobacteria bacterium]|nr:ATP-binding cassette domain-containing protein [Deltaproteobacteria bacterium]